MLDAFLVGSLGTWDPENDCLLQTVGIGRKYYGTLFKKLCCRDAISGSYEVWASRCRFTVLTCFPPAASNQLKPTAIRYSISLLLPYGIQNVTFLVGNFGTIEQSEQPWQDCMVALNMDWEPMGRISIPLHSVYTIYHYQYHSS